MDWTKVVFRVTGPEDKYPGQGTGFACAREGGALLVVTCWHVVRTIGRDKLRIDGLPCKVVSTVDGDDDLDLAVLRVEGLTAESVLPLAPHGARQDLPFETYGYEPVGRPLSGTLGAKLSRPHVSHQNVPAWDYYLREGARELEKIKDGYSGAPVCDPASGAVVAVITHRQGADKGFAIDICNLPRIYPRATTFFVEPEADLDGEYAADSDAPLAKLLDHVEQLAAIGDALADAETGRAIALVEACAEDWPSYLADHIHLYPWPEESGSLLEAIPLRLTRFDDRAFWQALIDGLPGAGHTRDEADRRTAVRDWINGASLRVLYAPVVLERHARHLPQIVRGAETTLSSLGDFAPGTRVLVVFACLRSAPKLPLWWPLYARLKLVSLGRCRRVGAMRLLETSDVETWYAGFPSPLRRYYDRDQLKAELLALFESGGSRIRYELARRRLVDEGALRRARIKT